MEHLNWSESFKTQQRKVAVSETHPDTTPQKEAPKCTLAKTPANRDAFPNPTLAVMGFLGVVQMVQKLPEPYATPTTAILALGSAAYFGNQAFKELIPQLSTKEQ